MLLSPPNMKTLKITIREVLPLLSEEGVAANSQKEAVRDWRPRLPLPAALAERKLLDASGSLRAFSKALAKVASAI